MDADVGVVVFEFACEAFGTVDRAVLPAGTAEGYHKMSEVAFDVFVDTLVDDGHCVVEETSHFWLCVKELHDGQVPSGVGLVFLIAPRVG